MLETIKSSTEISYLFAHGKRYNAHSITLLVSQGRNQHDPQGRVAFIAGKKSGNAVWRNAAKRRMRAVCRDLGGPWEGFDVVFLAKGFVLEQEYSKVLSSCRAQISRFAGE
ncbi:ribonuclease P protein component [Denitrobacterium detoxificans]|uniref:ribonuclease P protein component n=1 Tax=Denitrobacterium detoxificans TaxID=79604 RepID=UPI001F0B6DB4|nr:ribonuclease P protein component [Denitrobacterium detoxificans]